MLTLATATRDYARRLESGLLDSARDADLRPLAEAMGPEIWSWLYALRLTGQAPWRARPGTDERIERAIANRLMIADLDTWDRAIRVLDARMDRARVGELPIPPPLALPQEVRLGLEARRKAALDRLSRRRGRPTDASGGPAPVPDEGAHHPPLPSKPA
ncbi:hypothetical protein ABC766_30280 [Methylobacterium fujisawaense]|uniref:hypothetical protein n=1 Tax=Methylobacterium fujisawaense TaxID=107400 RepID=UPI0031F4D5CC